MMRWRVIDLETLKIAPAYLAPHPVSVAWADSTDAGNVTLRLWSDPRLLGELSEVLAGGVIGHNVAFDLGVIVQHYPALSSAVWLAYAEGRVLDTQIACRLADIREGNVEASYSLADCCQRVLGIQVEGKAGPDVWRLRYSELLHTPIAKWPAAAATYACDDVTHTANLWRKVGRQPTDEFQSRAAWALHLSSAWGLRCDPIEVAKLTEHLTLTMRQRDGVLRQYKILRSDGSKDMSLIMSLVQQDLGEDAPKTDTGAVRTDADTLKLCQHPALQALAEAAEAAKLQSTFLPKVLEGTRQPLHTRYNPILRSDRVSSSEPNVQQLPRKGGVRECFVPRAGCVFASVDYAGAELVCLAQVLIKEFGKSAMADAIRAGRDLHLVTASMLLGRSYDQTVADHKAREAKAVETRQLAKALNFGIPGGLAPKTLRTYLLGYGIQVTEEKAKELRNKWLQSYPEMAQYFDALKAKLRGGPVTITHPLTGFVRGQTKYTAACNHFFQSLLAKVAKEALWRVSVECYGALGTATALRGCRIAAFVHDEILIECPEATAHEAAMRLAQVMRGASQPWMPDLSLNAEPHLMRRWSKDAKEAWQDGRLVPWAP
jgi:DNA polymerase-1